MLFTGEQKRNNLILEVQLIQMCANVSPTACAQPPKERNASRGVRRSTGVSFPQRTDPVCRVWAASPHCNILHTLSLQIPDTWPSQNHLVCQECWERNQLKATGGAFPPKGWTSSLVAPLQWIYLVGKIWACIPGYLDRPLYRMH